LRRQHRRVVILTIDHRPSTIDHRPSSRHLPPPIKPVGARCPRARPPARSRPLHAQGRVHGGVHRASRVRRPSLLQPGRDGPCSPPQPSAPLHCRGQSAEPRPAHGEKGLVIEALRAPGPNLSSPRSWAPRWRIEPHITLLGNNVARYTRCVLRSFADKDTERIWRREPVRRLDQTTQRAALRKLLILDAAETLADLRVPPGNRLEKLVGDRAGQYSIRVNQQWRVCFRWRTGGADDVEIVDYH